MGGEQLCVIQVLEALGSSALAAMVLSSVCYSLDTLLRRLGYWQCFFSLILVVYGSHIWFRGSSEHSHSPTSVVPKVRGWLPGNIDVLWRLVYYDSYGYCGETLRKWSEIWGPTYDMNILWGHQIVTVDPANVKHMLVTEFDSFGKGSSFQQMLEPFLGNGIFSVDGKEWKARRILAKPFFSNERLFGHDHLTTLEFHVSKAMDAMSHHARSGANFNIQDLYSRLTFDIGTNFLFGDYISSEDRGYQRFSEAFTTVSEVATKRIRIGSNWRLFEFGFDPMESPMKVINSFIEPIILKALSESLPGAHGYDNSFLKHLIATHKTPEVMKEELLNFLLAIRDTTASLLTFTTYMLASYPEVVLKLRTEIDAVLGDKERITTNDIQRMPYLRAVLNEVLRLFPPVPYNIRRSLRDSHLPSPLSGAGPFPIMKGVSVTYVPFIIQRRRDLWGDDAESFNPGRWLTDSSRSPFLHTFAFHPFHGGPRLCLGQQYAYTECSYVILRLLTTFDQITVVSASLPPRILQRRELKALHRVSCWPRASLTLYLEGGLWIRLKRKNHY